MMGSLDSKGLELCWSFSWSEKGLELSLAVSGVHGPRHVLEFSWSVVGLQLLACGNNPVTYSLRT
jgi:hypothetical protein